MRLPRPKLFNRRRDREEKESSVRRFCQSFLAFVTCGVLVSTENEKRKEKNRTNIVRRILKIRKNKIGVDEGLNVNTEDILLPEKQVNTSNESIGKGKKKICLKNFP